MASISELRTVAGITPAIYNRISPYLIALPISTQLNPNSAPPLLLKAFNLTPPQGANAQQTSKHFLVRGDVYLEDQHLVMYSMLQIISNPTNNQPMVIVLWQSFGTM